MTPHLQDPQYLTDPLHCYTPSNTMELTCNWEFCFGYPKRGNKLLLLHFSACSRLNLKACNAVLVNPAWPVAPVSSHFYLAKRKNNHIYPKIWFFFMNWCGCICKKKVVKGKGYIILVYSAQLLVFHDSTWANLLNACWLISLWAECHKWESQRKRLILDETWVTAAERLQKHYFHWLEIKKDSKAV